MKTLTELSGSVIRAAAAAAAEARRSLPADEKPAAAAIPEAPAPPREAESGAAKEAIDAAVAKATGVSGDRLAMLLGALEAAGRRTEDVRLVRVFGLEEQVTGATKVGDYQYVVDLFPKSMAQSPAPRDERGGRGGGRGGAKGGGGGGRGGGDRGAKGSAGVGGFSMDSLREDRKNERGGRGGFGGGRKAGGGGGGGGSGGPPGGAPKK